MCVFCVGGVCVCVCCVLCVCVCVVCEQVQRTWQEITNRLNLREIYISNWKLIFMGIQGNSQRIKMCNSIILIMKYMIYFSRTKGVLPSMNKILTMISDYKDREEELAIKIRKLGLHLQKWEELNI